MSFGAQAHGGDTTAPKPSDDSDPSEEPVPDPVEEADRESFPASDPPSTWSGGAD
jgi:hypothetical protein